MGSEPRGVSKPGVDAVDSVSSTSFAMTFAFGPSLRLRWP